VVSIKPKKNTFFSWEPINGGRDSGTPSALLEAIGRQGRLLLLDNVNEGEVLVEFPFGDEWQERTGCLRFVRLRRPIEGAVYALVQRKT
jgi:hypothetical protein